MYAVLLEGSASEVTEYLRLPNEEVGKHTFQSEVVPVGKSAVGFSAVLKGGADAAARAKIVWDTIGKPAEGTEVGHSTRVGVSEVGHGSSVARVGVIDSRRAGGILGPPGSTCLAVCVPGVHVCVRALFVRTGARGGGVVGRRRV